MFQRRKHNVDLSGAKESIRQDQSTFGISWGIDQREERGHQTGSAIDKDLDYGWEEAEVGSGMATELENLRQQPPKGQSELAFSERQTTKIDPLRKPDPSYSGLQKKPDFNDQHKKLTVYIENELLQTIEALKKGRYISSYSWLVTEAIKQFLSGKKT